MLNRKHQRSGRYSPVSHCADSQRREPKGEVDSDESEEEEEEEEESEEESEEASSKPVIATNNPNHVKKGPVKATAVKGSPQELTRKERCNYYS